MSEQINNFQTISDINDAMKRACCSLDIFFLKEKVEQFESLRKVYSGREILELLQNADDAYSEYLQETKDTPQKVKVLIEYDGYHLKIFNKGKPFNMERVHVLCQGGLSNKEKVIGCKGKGFRSLLNFSNNISIYSGDLAFRFSREYADTQGAKIKDNPRVQEVFNKGISYPVLFAPEELSISTIDRGEWDTIIDIKHFDNDETRGQIEKQLNEFDAISLLFLPNINEVEIKKKNSTIVYKKVDKKDHKFYIEQNVNGVLDQDRSCLYYFFEETKYVQKKIDGSWEFVSRDLNENTKRLHNAVAIPERSKNFKIDDLNLFSFFAIRKEFTPFYATLHSTFELDEYRDNLVPKNSDKDLNIVVGKSLLDFYAKTVKEYFKPELFGNYATELLTPIGFKIFSNQIPHKRSARKSFVTDLKLLDYYLEQIKYNDNILYSVSGKSLSKSDNPRYISKEVPLPQCLKDSTSDSLLQKIVEFDSSLPHYTAMSAFFKEVFCAKELKENDLTQEVRKIAKEKNSEDRAEIVYWWYKNFKNSVKTLGILKDDKNEFIENNEKCFFTATITGTPAWANIQIIHKDDEKALIQAFREEIQSADETSSKRVLKSLIYISDQSNLPQVVNDVNNSIVNRDQAIEFVQWLYKFYYALNKEDSKKNIQQNLSLYIPTMENYLPKTFVYLGSEYGNDFTEKICSNLGMQAVASYNDFNTNDFFWTQEEAKDFFEELEIATRPELKPTDVTDKEEKTYLNYVSKTLSEDKIKNFGSWCSSKSRILRIEHIQNIKIEKIGTENLLAWILSDKKLYNSIVSELCDSKLVYTLARPGSAGMGATKQYKGDIPSYMHWFFKKHPWISINGCYVLPENVLMDSVRAELWYQNLPSTYSQADIENLLKKLGVKSDIIGSKAEDFYKEILRQSTEKDETSAVKLYRKIADPNNNEMLEAIINYTGPEFQKFREQGCVWAINRDGKEEFHKATDTYYTSSAVLNFSNKFIMKTPSRQGKAEIFTQIFGIKEFKEEKIEVLKYEEDSKNLEFVSDLRDFIPYFLVLRGMTNDRTASNDKIFNDFRNLTVTLAAKISLNAVAEDGATTNITDIKPYSVIKQSPSQWFIYTGDEGYAKTRVGEALKTIFYVVLNRPAAEQLEYCESYFPHGKDYCKRKLEEKGFLVSEAEQIAQRIDDAINYEEKLREAFHDLSFDEETVNLIKNIDFLRAGKYSEHIVRLAKKIGKDISELATAIGINLSIEKHNKALLNACIATNETRIYHFFVQALEKKSIEEKSSLEDLMTQLKVWAKSINVETIPELNSVDFNAREILKKQLKDYQFDYETPYKDDVYESNKARLFEICEIRSDDISFEDSLLHFPIDWDSPEDPIVQVLREKLKESKPVENGNASKEPERLAGASVKDDDIPISNYTYRASAGKGSGAFNGGKGNGEPSQHHGDMAEFEVYNMIIEKKIRQVECIVGNYTADSDHVKWISGAAHRIKKAKANDSKGYDMEIYGDDGKYLYIEIKSSTGLECSFFMSENERLAAEKHGKNYAVIFVGGVTTKEPEVRFVGNPLISLDENAEENALKGRFIFTPLKYHVDFKGKEL